MKKELQHQVPAKSGNAELNQRRLPLEHMNTLAVEAVAKNGGYVDGVDDFLAIMHGAQCIDDIQDSTELVECYERIQATARAALEAIVLQNPTHGMMAIYARAAGHRESPAQSSEDPLSELAYRIGRDPNTDEWIGVVELPVYRYFQAHDSDAYVGLQAGSEGDAVLNGVITLQSFRRAQDTTEADLRPRNSPSEKTTIERWNIGKEEILHRSREYGDTTPLAVLEEMITAVAAIRASRGL